MASGNGSFRDQWKRYMLRHKVQSVIASVIAIILGIMFIFWPNSTISVMLRIFAVFMILAGIEFLVSSGRAVTGMERNFTGVAGGLCLIFGLLILINPVFFLDFAMTLLGISLFVYAIEAIVGSGDMREAGLGGWQTTLASGIISLIIGILAIVHPFSTIGIIAGISCIYAGVTSLAMTRQVGRFERTVDDFMDSADGDVIDSTATEEDEDD
ncbi:MAG: HdeD family acid-resistance protein [Bilifractor sp.]|jgi:hypothetical protein